MTRVLYVGLDVSLEMTSIRGVDAEGGMILEAKAASDPADIGEVLAGIDGTFERVGFEAGPLSQWLYNGLTSARLPAVCIEARHAKAAMVAMNRSKNDRNDARSLAQLIRSGWFKAVHVKSTESQEKRTLLMSREFFVNKLRDHENEIRGLLRPFGLKVCRVAARDFETRVRELVEGHPNLELCMSALLRGRTEMKTQLAELRRAPLRLTANDELCRRFMTIPGVGPVTALAFKATIDDPGRFRRWSDVGVDWHTRKVLAWRISNTLEADFCVEALNEAIDKFGPPEIMNPDQGSQFTSIAWTGRLRQSSVRISMDGKGRFLDDIFIERLWRSLKCECVHLHAWETGSEAKAGVRKWMDFYNRKRPHPALGGKPPATVYWLRKKTVKPDQQEQRVA